MNENGKEKVEEVTQEKKSETCRERENAENQSENVKAPEEKTEEPKTENENESSEKKSEKPDEEKDHIKLEDLSVEELRKFVMYQKSINEALTKENEQLTREKQELARVIANSDKYLDQLVALKSDFSSYKERIRSDAERSRDEGKTAALEKILPLLDTLEKARVDVADGKAYELIYRLFTKALFEMGVEEIEVLDLPFDPSVANAVTNRETPEEQKGKVIEVYQKGYKYKNKILRYAQVIVGK